MQWSTAFVCGVEQPTRVLSPSLSGRIIVIPFYKLSLLYLAGLTVAEYFRDYEGQDVLLFIDNIFRFTQAGSEVSALLGRIPSAVGYQPTLATDMGAMQVREATSLPKQLPQSSVFRESCRFDMMMHV